MDPLLVRARNPSAWTGPAGNNTFLLRGAVPTLIDAGVGDPAHVDEIASALGGEALAAVLLTHAHSDHASGVPALRARWPQVRVSIGTFPEVIAAGDGRLRAIHTPGHSPDHFCFFDESSRDVFCGDLLRATGTIVIPASKGGNLRDYLASLRRVRDLAPKRLLPGHGPIVADPVPLIDSYIAHRTEREQQILEALREQPRTPEQLLPRIYAELPSGLESAAMENILAHLIKLEEEKRVARSAEGSWQRV